jgi:hypothetical protein
LAQEGLGLEEHISLVQTGTRATRVGGNITLDIPDIFGLSVASTVVSKSMSIGAGTLGKAEALLDIPDIFGL